MTAQSFRSTATTTSTVAFVIVAGAIGFIPVAAARQGSQEPFIRYAASSSTPNEGYPVPADLATVHSLRVTDAANAGLDANLEEKAAIMSRSEELELLADGWLGPKSKAPDARLLEWVRDHSSLLAASVAPVSIIPMAAGALALQWATGSCEYTAELHPDMQMLLFVDHLESDEMEEFAAPLGDRALAAFLATGSVV